MQQKLNKYFQVQQGPQKLYKYPIITAAQKNMLDKFNGQQNLEQMFELVQTLNQAKNIENFRQAIIQLVEGPRGLFIGKSLPKMAQMSKKFINYLPKSINLLDEGNKQLELNREQIYTLLSLGFFGLLTNDSQGNFNDLMNKRERDAKNDRKIAKLQCLIHYFNCDRVNPEDVVLFRRITIDPQYHCKLFFQSKSSTITKELWLNSQIILTDVNLTWKQKIEDFDDAIMVDFADSYIGGGVMRTGLVQEEIMLITHPESLVSLMFTSKLETDDAVLICNAKNHSEYSGYANSFKCTSSGTLKNKHILAIDALNYSRYPNLQYDEFNVLRDLNKCFIGFSQWKESPLIQNSIATGNWGCGIFKGDVGLKFLLQWMAFSQVQINQPKAKFIYCAFEEPKFIKIRDLIEKYRGRTVGEIAQIVFSYQG